MSAIQNQLIISALDTINYYSSRKCCGRMV